MASWKKTSGHGQGIQDTNTDLWFFRNKNKSGKYKMTLKEKRLLRKEIGMVFQSGALFDSETIENNIMFPLKMFTNQSYEEMLERVNFVLNRVHLENVNNKYPAEISGGMQKRVAIARAMIQKPCYMFYDEPTTGLDEANVEMVVELIRKFKKRVCATAVIVTHDIHLMHAVSDRVVLLKEGKIVFVGKKEEISEESLHRLYDTGVRDDL